MVSPERWTKWGKWADELEVEIIHYHNRHQMWDGITSDIKAGGHPDMGYFLDFFTEMWGAAQASTIRRLVDPRRDVVSLHRLLRDINGSAQEVTKERFLLGWNLDRLDERDERDRHMKAMMNKNADRCWERVAGSATAPSLTAKGVQKDIEAVELAGDAVKRFVDDNLAHRSSGVRATATFADLDKAMDAILDIFRRYNILLSGSSPTTMTPTIPGDWKGPFRKPLF